ncbi:hypothetical protein SDC9_86895 [bioreactor metagenome]|uniref:Uncharacterized protein n=1 Tax=bioreactor metagenome TaxID=1076179 RepID=A0A644ZH86_9ZZZZ
MRGSRRHGFGEPQIAEVDDVGAVQLHVVRAVEEVVEPHGSGRILPASQKFDRIPVARPLRRVVHRRDDPGLVVAVEFPHAVHVVEAPQILLDESIAVVELGRVEIRILRFQPIKEELAEHAAHGDGPAVDRECLEAACQRNSREILRLAEPLASVAPDLLDTAALASGRVVVEELESNQGAFAPDLRKCEFLFEELDLVDGVGVCSFLFGCVFHFERKVSASRRIGHLGPLDDKHFAFQDAVNVELGQPDIVGEVVDVLRRLAGARILHGGRSVGERAVGIGREVRDDVFMVARIDRPGQCQCEVMPLPQLQTVVGACVRNRLPVVLRQHVFRLAVGPEDAEMVTIKRIGIRRVDQAELAAPVELSEAAEAQSVVAVFGRKIGGKEIRIVSVRDIGGLNRLLRHAVDEKRRRRGVLLNQRRSPGLVGEIAFVEAPPVRRREFRLGKLDAPETQNDRFRLAVFRPYRDPVEMVSDGFRLGNLEGQRRRAVMHRARLRAEVEVFRRELPAGVRRMRRDGHLQRNVVVRLRVDHRMTVDRAVLKFDVGGSVVIRFHAQMRRGFRPDRFFAVRRRPGQNLFNRQIRAGTGEEHIRKKRPPVFVNVVQHQSSLKMKYSASPVAERLSPAKKSSIECRRAGFAFRNPPATPV